MHRFACSELDPVTGHLQLGAIIPNGWMWDGKNSRCYCGGEQMALQGFPVRTYQSQLLALDEILLRDISGNMFPGTIITNFMHALMAGVQGQLPPVTSYLEWNDQQLSPTTLFKASCEGLDIDPDSDC